MNATDVIHTRYCATMARLSPLARPLRALRRLLPPLNFITIHYAYFIVLCLLSALVFWGSNTPDRTLKVRFIDSLFLCGKRIFSHHLIHLLILPLIISQSLQ